MRYCSQNYHHFGRLLRAIHILGQYLCSYTYQPKQLLRPPILILWNVALDAVCNISLLHLGPEKEKKTHYYGHHTRKVVVGLKKKPISRQFFLHFYITGVDLSMLVAILTMKNLKLFQTKEMNGEIHELTQRKPENFTHLSSHLQHQKNGNILPYLLP